MQTLKYDIIESKPAFDIKEGVFFDRIEGFVIKIGKKERDDSTIRNVVIYEQNNNSQVDNMIIADSGTMVVTPDKQNLIFTLESGWRYQEKGDRSVANGTELVRLGFKKYKKVMDLSSFKMMQTNDSNFKSNHAMRTIIQLGHDIDSMQKITNAYITQIGNNAASPLKFPAWLDTTGWEKVEKQPELHDTLLLKVDWARDSLKKAWVVAKRAEDSTNHVHDSIDKAQKRIAEAAKKAGPGGKAGGAATASTWVPLNSVPKEAPEPTLGDIIPDSLRVNMIDRAIGIVNQSRTSLYQPEALYQTEAHSLLNYEVSWHEKITLAVACLVMFLIGAPLGSIIRKGGIGLPLVFAVVFFVIFFLLNNFGKKLAGQSVLSPVGGMWMATYVLTPIGIFLVYKALHDSQLFNKEFYFRLTKKIRTLLTRMQWKKVSKIS
jgi:lipopolysaccharide export system permease protein